MNLQIVLWKFAECEQKKKKKHWNDEKHKTIQPWIYLHNLIKLKNHDI